MAIKVLDATETHAPEHDLESIFYVLVWICSYYSGPSQKQPAFILESLAIRDWADKSKTLLQIADIKHGHVADEDYFKKRVVRFFPPYFRPLEECAIQLRGLLFPNTNLKPKPTYEGFIAVLHKALLGLPDETHNPTSHSSVFNFVTAPYTDGPIIGEDESSSDETDDDE
jgi:hypothetical protein